MPYHGTIIRIFRHYTVTVYPICDIMANEYSYIYSVVYTVDIGILGIVPNFENVFGEHRFR